MILVEFYSKFKSFPLQAKPTISPALETAIDYQLKILSVAISYGGPALLRYKDQFKDAVVSAFESPSWKVLCCDEFCFLMINSFFLHTFVFSCILMTFVSTCDAH